MIQTLKTPYILLHLCVMLWSFGLVGQKSVALSDNLITSNHDNPFKSGEYFKFRIHYGFINAGYATLEVTDDPLNANGYHIKGFGATTGLSRFFFKVEDYYDTKMDKTSFLPYEFTRKINEGGYTKHKVISFDQAQEKAYVNDKKRSKKYVFDVEGPMQDMVSTFYYLRKHVDVANLTVGDETLVTMFFDNKMHPFKLRFLGRDTIKTKFGSIKALMFRPLVLAGRVFKEEESLTVWVSDDVNKVPLRIQASLAVGSIKADLEECRNTIQPLSIIK